MATATKQSTKAETRPHYEEWRVEFKKTQTGPVYEKLKMIRPRVLLTEEQAEVLNTGVLYGDNNYGVMYFLPENQ